MEFSQRPISGYFYTDSSGQLVRVRLLLYVGSRVSRVVIEYLDNQILYVSMEEWEDLELEVYTEWHGMRLRDMEREYEL